MSALRAWLVLTLAFTVATAGRAEQRTATYPDGTPKLVYDVDADGRRHGKLEAFYPDGTRKGEATYSRGQLSGLFRSYHPGGKIRVRATYRDGKRHGEYEEHGPDGGLALSASYRDGQLHGPRQERSGRRIVADELWIDGDLVIPKSPAVLARELAAIERSQVETVGSPPAGNAQMLAMLQDGARRQARQAALRRLAAYRCAVGVPYEHLKLDWTYTAHALAGAMLLAQIGRLEHNPTNPGLPEADFQFAAKGTGSSNLHAAGSPSPAMLTEAVDSFMDDSDPGNIDRLGHRRWCLNPAMGKTGFGRAGGFAAMWVFDSSFSGDFDYDFIAFPPRGVVPTRMFRDHYAWNVSLHPDKYQPADQASVQVRVAPARLNVRELAIEKSPQALPIQYFACSHERFGVPNCIIFRPAGVQVAGNAAYAVEITGLRTKSGAETSIEYLVVFTSL